VVATGLLLVPVIVGAARLYRGMHHPTDVLFGALGGGLWLTLVLLTLLPSRPDDDPSHSVVREPLGDGAVVEDARTTQVPRAVA
jgi:membrane-associated phospholipid phosphatase